MGFEPASSLAWKHEIAISVHQRDRTASGDSVVVTELPRHLPAINKARSRASEMQESIAPSQGDGGTRRQSLRYIDDAGVVDAWDVTHASESRAAKTGK